MCSRPRQVALLTYLALAKPRGFHRRDSLLALLWPDADQEHARNSLRQALHQIRQALGDDVILSRGDQEIAVASDRLLCDASQFDDLADAARHAEALERYGGPLLPGFFLDDAPAFEEWLEVQRARLHDRAARSAWALSEIAERTGDLRTAADHARQAAALEPLSETAVQRLLETLVRSGDRPGAARAFDEYAARVREELDVEPAPETRALAAALRTAMANEPLPVAANLSTPFAAPRAETVAPGHIRKHGTWRMLAAGVLTVSLSVTALVAFRSSPPKDGENVIEGVAVLPFAVRGHPELAYLSEGLVDLLSAKLDGTRRLRSIDPRAIVTASRAGDGTAGVEPASRGKIAEQFGARWFVIGDVVEIAGRVRLTASMYQHGRDRPAAIASVEGDVSNLFALVDDLVGRLLAGVIVGRDSALTNLASLTTRSLPALKAFLDGEREFRAGRDAQAVAAFRDAIALDTGFALAYYRLAMAVRWSPSSSDGPTLAAQALARARRLPPLAQDLVRGYDAYLKGDIDLAERLFRHATRSHPDNVDGWFMLGETLFHFNLFRGRPLSESWDAFSRVLALVGDEPHALLHLARVAAVEKRHAALDSLVERFLTLNAGAERAVEMRALRAFVSGGDAEQIALAHEVRGENDLVMSSVLDAVTTYGENLRAAALVAPALQTPGRERESLTWGMRVITQAGWGRGIRRSSAAVAQLYQMEPDWALEVHAIFAADVLNGVGLAELTAVRDSMRTRAGLRATEPRTYRYHGDIDPQVHAYLLGLLSMRMGDTAAASKYASELVQLSGVRADSGIGLGLARIIRADVARNNGSPVQALKELDAYFTNLRVYGSLQVSHSVGYARFLKAEMLHALDRDDEALQWYASFGGSPDLMQLAQSHRRRAQIYAGRGDRAKAKEHYMRFIALWKDCDADLRPMVTEAQHALARL